MDSMENIDPAVEGMDADTTPEDPFLAAEADARAAVYAEDEEAEDKADDPESEDAQELAEDDGDTEDEANPESAEADEEVDEYGLTEADHNHPDIANKLKGLDKYINAKMREIASIEREQKRLLADLMTKRTAENTGPAQEAGGPPPKPGKDATEAEWDAYYDARAEYIAEQKLAPVMEKLKGYEQGFTTVQQQEQGAKWDAYVMSRDGFTPEVGQKIIELAQADETGQTARRIVTDKALTDAYFAQAKLLVEREKELASVAASKTEAIKRQKGAAKRAGVRSAASPKSAPIDPMAQANLKGMSTDEKMRLAEKSALEEFRS